MADLALLEKLCLARGISGNEDAVRKLILSEIEPYADRIEQTPLGNLIVYKKGKKTAATKLMLSAHMDEVGMIVTGIKKDGTLSFSCVGGIDARVLCGKRVHVSSLPGVIGIRPIHLTVGDESRKEIPVDRLCIDIGAKTEEEAKAFVSPGMPVTFEDFFECSRGTIKGRALDDRAGCTILVDLIKKELSHDMVFAFVVQEEIGLRGARTAAYHIAPEAAIVVESTTAADVANVPADQTVCCVGKGPVLSFMDRSTIYDKEYYALAQSLAQENQIPYQSKRAVAGGNDAGAIHVSREGVRTAAISLACRYLHTPCGLISEEDLHHTEELVGLLAERIAGGIC